MRLHVITCEFFWIIFLLSLLLALFRCRLSCKLKEAEDLILMENFEAKLKEYRRRKQRELRYARFRQYFQRLLPFGKTNNGAAEQSDDRKATTNSRLQVNVRGFYSYIYINT